MNCPKCGLLVGINMPHTCPTNAPTFTYSDKTSLLVYVDGLEKAVKNNQASLVMQDQLLANQKKHIQNLENAISTRTQRIRELEAALDKAAHQLYDYSGSCPSDLYDWEHPRSCSKVCAGYEDPSEAWECWLVWLLSSKEEK